MERKSCLVQDEKLVKAIEYLLEAMKDDYFMHGLKECGECKTVMQTERTLFIHSQLKTVYNSLSSVLKEIDLLQQEERKENSD